MAGFLNQIGKVGFCFGEGRTAQAIIGTEFDYDDRRMVLKQSGCDALASTGGGFSADAGIDDLILRMAVLQFLLQQIDPAGFTRNSISGREAVAENQQGGLRIADCRKQATQAKNNETEKNGKFHGNYCAGS